MKKAIVFLLIIIICKTSYAQERFALLIGNAKYTNIGELQNSANDAIDLNTVLKESGWKTELLIDANRREMDNAINRLNNHLSTSRNSYGFLFYAGHGTQTNDGLNYLIPIDANYQNENALKSQAISVQGVLNELSNSSNELNIVVLDACRNNPFDWAQNESKGLNSIDVQPAGSIIVFATSAGSVAIDNGTDRNGLFSSYLISNAAIPGISIRDLFYKTGRDVVIASGGSQHPAIYSQYFGDAFIGSEINIINTSSSISNQYVNTDIKPIHSLASVPPNHIQVKNINYFNDDRRLLSVGLNLGSAFDMSQIIVGNINITVPLLPWTFIECGVETRLLYSISEQEKERILDDFSWYYYSRLNLFFPFNTHGGIKLGFGLGTYDDLTMQKLTYDATTGIYFGKNRNLFRISYAIRFANFNYLLIDHTKVDHRLFMGYTFRIFN